MKSGTKVTRGMSSFKLINYAHGLALHPLIAEHPLYNAMLSSKLDNFEFVKDVPSEILNIIPTYYKPLDLNHCVVIEDYITLFYPHIHNGSNFSINPTHAPWFPQYKEAFSRDCFKGVITHMKQTIESLNYMFGKDLSHKWHYVPLMYKSNATEIKKTDPNRIVLTFTNSFGGQAPNFLLRGGLEVVCAFKRLYEKGNTHLHLNLVGSLGLDEELTKWVEDCPNVYLHGHDTTMHNRGMMKDTTIHNILLDTDIFMIPSCRIHSMSVVRSQAYGICVIGSDGWGFDEFLDKKFCCEGQSEMSYVEDSLLREKYSLNLPSPNTKLVDSIMDKVLALSESPDMLDSYKEDNLKASKANVENLEKERNLDKALKAMTK